MDLHALAHAFRLGQIEGPHGPIVAESAMLTRKSLLVMTTNSVLKLRRPRLIDGYDQGLLSIRYGMAARERWLGRQLSPTTYLGDCVIQIRFDGDAPTIHLVEGLVEGEPVVAMQRLPEDHRADNLLMSTWVAPSAFDPIVDALVAFHTASPPHRLAPYGTPHRPAERLAQFATLLPPSVWPSPDTREAFLADTEARHYAAEKTIEHRIMEGRIREVHGELTLEHIFLDPSSTWSGDGRGAIIDPHDGSDSERTVDTAEEILRLGLELELLCGRAFADAVVERYASHTMDLTLRKVAVFYRRLAALRMAAIAIIEGEDLEGGVVPDEGHERARTILAWIADNP